MYGYTYYIQPNETKADYFWSIDIYPVGAPTFAIES